MRYGILFQKLEQTTIIRILHYFYWLLQSLKKKKTNLKQFVELKGNQNNEQILLVIPQELNVSCFDSFYVVQTNIFLEFSK